MLAMFTAFWFWALGGLDPMLSLPFVAILLALAGILAHFGIIRRLLKAPMLAQVCGTFGLGVALRAGAQFLWTPDFRTITNPLIAGVSIGVVESLGGLLLDPSYKTLIVFGLYLAVVVFRPQGLFGRF